MNLVVVTNDAAEIEISRRDIPALPEELAGRLEEAAAAPEGAQLLE